MISLRSVIKQCQYNDVLPSTNRHNTQISNSQELQNDMNKNHERLQIKDAFEKAKKIIDAANQYSTNHIRETSERIDVESTAIREKSKSDGFEEGYVAGFDQGQKEGYTAGYDEGMHLALENNKKMTENLAQIFKSLEEVREDIIAQQNTQMVDLALEIAQTILQEEVSINPNAVTSIVKETIEKYKNQEWINVHIAQSVCDALNDMDSSLFNEIQSYSKGIHIKPSIGLHDLDCLIELPGQLVDVSADTQINKIKAVLKRT